MFFYEDYRLVLLWCQQAFMMAVAGMRVDGISLAISCQAAKVYGGDQTYVLLTPIRYSVSGIRGGGHILIQAGMTAEGSAKALGNFNLM